MSQKNHLDNPLPQKVKDLDWKTLSEDDVKALIMRYISRKVKIFNNPVGTGYQGKAVSTNKGLYIQSPRQIKFGLCEGSSDLIGFTKITITPEMVGKEVAVFTAIEVKKHKGVSSKAQRTFIKIVKENGGFAGIARTVDEANDLIKWNDEDK